MRTALSLCIVLVLMVMPRAVMGGQDLGPSTPRTAPGGLSLETGYCYQTSGWKTDTNDHAWGDVHQEFWYGGVAYGLGEGWEGYMRAGACRMELKSQKTMRVRADLLGSAFDFMGEPETDYRPYFTVGVRGAFFRRPQLAFGAQFQINYYTRSKTEHAGTFWVFDYGDIYYRETIEIRNRYDLDLGVNVDFISDWGIMYLGVFYFRAAAKASGLRVEDEPPWEYTFEANIEEKGDFRVNTGIRIVAMKAWYVTAEWHFKPYRMTGSISLSLSRAFGAPQQAD